MLICTSNAQVANSRLTYTVRPVILPTVNSAGNAALQITDAHVEGYRAALDDVRNEIGALAGTGIRAHDAAIADVLELIEKLQGRSHTGARIETRPSAVSQQDSRDHVAVAPQRHVKAPAVGVPPNDAAGATFIREKNLERHLETIRRYAAGLPTRGL